MKRQLSILVVLLAVAGLISLAVSAQTKKAPAKKAPAAKPAAGKGADAAPIWKQHCAKCHAADGKGIESLEPPDMTSEKWQTATDDKAITEAINEGKGVMPGFKDTLKPAQVAALLKHIRSLKAASEKK
ncbi:MAG: c-type cytochrome [Blastocatellia bacterium]